MRASDQTLKEIQAMIKAQEIKNAFTEQVEQATKSSDVQQQVQWLNRMRVDGEVELKFRRN